MPALIISNPPLLQHPKLGCTFRGVRHPVSDAPSSSSHVIHQYRGIKYASIPARFTPSVILTSSSYPSNQIVDATTHGPICPQPKLYSRNLDRAQYGLMPGMVPREEFRMDEMECLNLVVTCPAPPPGVNNSSGEGKYPVMVWIHGGGNITGSGSRWLLDGGNLVKKSMEIGKPLVIVSLNYRLGLFGFAASPSLRPSPSSPVGNYGLQDQLTALAWIQTNISAFGGDPTRITLCGEGKGASDVHALLLSGRLAKELPVPGGVKRAILQSGTCPPTLPTPSQHHVELCRVMSFLGLECASVDELRNVKAEELVRAVLKSGVRVGLCDDGVFFPPSSLSPSQAQSLGVDALLLGDTHAESAPYVTPASYWTSLTLSRRIKAVLRSPLKTDALLRAFEVSEENERELGREELAEKVGELIGDCLVAYGVERLANRLAAVNPGMRLIDGAPATADPKEKRTKVYRFTFDQPSPFNLSAHHAVDLVYLFGNIDFGLSASHPSSPLTTYPNTPANPVDPSQTPKHNDVTPTTEKAEEESFAGFGDPSSYSGSSAFDGFMSTEDEKRVSESMQAKWIEFVHGEEIWGEYRTCGGSPGGGVGIGFGGSGNSWQLGSGGTYPATPPPSAISGRFGFEGPCSSLGTLCEEEAEDEDESSSPSSPAQPSEEQKEGTIYVFGPTGDAYSAPVSELGWRRRVDKWREAFEGEEGEVDMRDVVKVGMELANGPVGWRKS